MHFAVQPDVFEHFATVGFERAAEVVNVHAGDPADQAVGDHRRYPARDELVVSILSPPADDVPAGRVVEFGDYGVDVVRVVLHVAVHGHEDPSLGHFESSGQSGGLAEVAGQLDDREPWVVARSLPKVHDRAVAAAVIDDYGSINFANG